MPESELRAMRFHFPSFRRMDPSIMIRKLLNVSNHSHKGRKKKGLLIRKCELEDNFGKLKILIQTLLELNECINDKLIYSSRLVNLMNRH